MNSHFLASAEADLGAVEQMNDIQSIVGSVLRLPAHRVAYPREVVAALGQLYCEYNLVFRRLLSVNTEWPTDYQACLRVDDSPVNYLVQIDMRGLSQAFLDATGQMTVEQVRQALRGSIFEIENSLAMYQVLERTFFVGAGDTAFRRGFRTALEDIRVAHRRPIALLSVTEEKYAAMAALEFGIKEGVVSDEIVRELSGFDRFFGPTQFREYLASQRGTCEYLLYVRSSQPVEKLKKPNTVVEHPLLRDPTLRQLIRANTLTFNVDDPGSDHASRINDTKEYLSYMGMAFPICKESDLLSEQLISHLSSGRAFDEFEGCRLSPGFASFLRDLGINPDLVGSGEHWLRAKPMKGAYGCYGHRRGALTDRDFRSRLKKEINVRGPYVIQPEMQMPEVVNAADGTAYHYIDRIIMSFTNGEPCFVGGFRGLLPKDSHEARQGRIHGNASTIWAEILAS